MTKVAKTISGQLDGMSATIVTVETDCSRGLHSFNIIGLGDKAVEEARDRVASAIKHSGYTSPKQKNQKIVISLIPAHIKKAGSHYDLAMSISYLLATESISADVSNIFFIGELSLDGTLNGVQGALSLITSAQKNGYAYAVVPKENVQEAALIKGITILPAQSLQEVIAHLTHTTPLAPQPLTDPFSVAVLHKEDVLEHIRGQEAGKRAILIAASGGHNVALYGPPGTGKTLLAHAFSQLLPPLLFEEIIEVTGIHSINGSLKDTIIVMPPFRSPHHTSSHVAVIGGGVPIRPGDISLSHKGVLFLDEFPEFDRRVIEALRQPLEEKEIIISRSRERATYPADCSVVIAFNPSPSAGGGKVSLQSSLQYQKKLSGPIMDRIDIWVEVESTKHDTLKQDYQPHEEDISTTKARNLITQARDMQKNRYEHAPHINKNSDLTSKNIYDFVQLTTQAEEILQQASSKLGLSARGYHRVIKVARTIADIDNSQELCNHHILEALSYRPHSF